MFFGARFGVVSNSDPSVIRITSYSHHCSIEYRFCPLPPEDH
jgi:hypothetical protein